MKKILQTDKYRALIFEDIKCSSTCAFWWCVTSIFIRL